MRSHINVENVLAAIAGILFQQGCKQQSVLLHDFGGLLLRESGPL